MERGARPRRRPVPVSGLALAGAAVFALGCLVAATRCGAQAPPDGAKSDGSQSNSDALPPALAAPDGPPTKGDSSEPVGGLPPPPLPPPLPPPPPAPAKAPAKKPHGLRLPHLDRLEHLTHLDRLPHMDLPHMDVPRVELPQLTRYLPRVTISTSAPDLKKDAKEAASAKGPRKSFLETMRESLREVGAPYMPRPKSKPGNKDQKEPPKEGPSARIIKGWEFFIG